MGTRISGCYMQKDMVVQCFSARVNTSFKRGPALLYGFHMGNYSWSSANPLQQALTTGRAPSHSLEVAMKEMRTQRTEPSGIVRTEQKYKKKVSNTNGNCFSPKRTSRHTPKKGPIVYKHGYTEIQKYYWWGWSEVQTMKNNNLNTYSFLRFR